MKINKYLTVLAVVATTVMSCEKDYDLTPREIGKDVNPEIAYPEQAGEVEVFKTAEGPIMVETFGSEHVLEGDIILSEEQYQILKQASASGRTESVYTDKLSKRWPGGVVPYVITSSTLTNRAMDAMQHIMDHSQVVFVPRTNQSNYVKFVTGSSCSSSVGMVGGAQNITLSGGCSTGNTIHELCHAIGIYHEQSRNDRNNHVTIHWDNIQDGKSGNFNTHSDGYDFGQFDLGSIMMYSSYAFSKNGQPTITRKNGTTFSTQRDGLSLEDKYAINHIYPSLWTKLPGGATDIAISANGHKYITGASWAGNGGHNVYKWNGSGWSQIGGQGVKLAVAPNGTPWLINAEGSIYRRNLAANTWQKMPGKAFDIGIGANGDVYITGYTQIGTGGNGIYKWNGSGWSIMSGEAIRVAVMPDGTPWVVNKQGNIYRRSGNSWVKLDGKANDIAIGKNGEVFVIGYTNENGNYGIYQRKGGEWVRLPGGGTRITVNSNGLPWVVNKDKNIFRLNTLNP